MKLYIIYIALFIAMLFSSVFLKAQSMTFNKLSADSVRTGKWFTILDKELKPTQDSLRYPYYRVVNYVSGKPIGFVNYYYRSGKLFFQTVAKSLDPDVYIDGEIKYFAENGEIIRELNYVNGMLNGEAAYYYADGDPQLQGYYTDNVKTGFWKQYKQDGKYGIGALENELPDGKWTFYYADGSVSSEGKFRKGIQQGKWIEYRESGETAEGNYLNGLPEGAWICKMPNGKPLFEGIYRQGKRNGAWKEWNIFGQLSQGSYSDDIKQGQWTIYDSEGNKQLQGNYLNGKEDGVWQKFDAIGNVTESLTYVDGVITEPPK